MSADREMPRYRSHKEVHALEIAGVSPVDGTADDFTMFFQEHGFAPIRVNRTLFSRYMAVRGDFYVVYEDGYESISPRQAFLDGYTAILPPDPMGNRHLP